MPDVDCDVATKTLLKAVLKGLNYHNKIMMNDVITKTTEDVEDGFWRDRAAVVEAAKWPPMVQNYLDNMDKAVEKMVVRIEKAAAREVERKAREAAAEEAEERMKLAAELEAAVARQKELDDEAERQSKEEENKLAAELLANIVKRPAGDGSRKSKHSDVPMASDDDATADDKEVHFEDADPQVDVQAIRGSKASGRKRKRVSKHKPAEPSNELNILSQKLEEDL